MEVVRDNLLHCREVSFQMPEEVVRSALQGGSRSMFDAAQQVLRGVGLAIEVEPDISASVMWMPVIADGSMLVRINSR